MTPKLPLTYEDVRAAAARLRGITRRTPVIQKSEIDSRAGNTLFVKCENLQQAGAFKLRGAYNRLSQLSTDERAHGVVAFSSGNHAQGVALAAHLLGIEATIVMPNDAPATKLEATKSFGACVVGYNRASEDREQIARDISARTGAVLVPPFDDYRIMAGQGTAALELLEEVPQLDALLVPLGGGGLLAGSAVVAKHERPSLILFGVEPAAGNDWQLSWQRGEVVSIGEPETIADGLRVRSPGKLTWPVVRALADGIVTVSDDEIRSAMQLWFESTQQVVEPSGAVALAAALSRKVGIAGKRVGVILSGGNVDKELFAQLVATT